MGLEMSTTEQGAWTVAAPEGELDVSNCDELGEQLQRLLEAGRTQVVVDLQGVSFLDSTTLGALVASHRAFDAAGAQLRVAAAAPSVRRVFDLTGLGATLGLASATSEITGA